MNSKDIKAMRWHKNSLMAAIRAAGINIDYVDEVLDSIINNLDYERAENSEVNVARVEGYTLGYAAGQSSMYTNCEAPDGESNE